jgi:xanthine dehydrogenase YagS FAD-binding subunit
MERGSWDFAVVSVGAVIRKDGDRIESGRMAFGGVAPAPWQEDGINRRLSGLSAGPDSIAGLAESAFEDAQPLDQNTYKLPLVRNLIKRLLMRL